MLAKGKLTTDSSNHTGQGIFFTSKMFDAFEIISARERLSFESGEYKSGISANRNIEQGTLVWMKLSKNSKKTIKKIFNQFTVGNDFGFNLTKFPIKLAQYAEENLISRSEAKRILARLDQFRVVIFDFAGINTIGQGFADEIFRVFANQHPDIELRTENINDDIKKMISRAQHKV